MNQRWFQRLLLIGLVTLGVAAAAEARTKDQVVKKDGASEDVQRTPRGAFDLQRNVVSNIDFYTTNYGIFGYNIANQVGGTFWPRGLRNQYVFAGGAWFGALKRPPGSTDLRKRVMITYNPNSGDSWMVPGSIEDGNSQVPPGTVDQGGEATNKFRTAFSTDFSVTEGVDFLNPTFPNWPIWDSSPSDTLRVNNYYGYYINDVAQRNKATFDKGPAYVSDEDVFAIYRDTDLSRYEGGAARREGEGFPLGFQIEQMIYSWGFGDYADFIFLKYMFIHPEQFPDTLYSCWMASVMDVDIALGTNPVGGAQNDRARYYTEEDSLNLAVQWTNSDRGEAGQGFGYLGFNFLESPAVDADGFLRKDKKQFPVQEQLGLRTMRNWPITVDPIENEDRYNFMSSGQRDGDDGPGDRRMLMATGPFNMRPGDSARIVVGIILGTTSSGKDATGETTDMAELIRKVRFAQFVYNNQFRAPKAPDLPIIKGYPSDASFFQVPAAGWLPLNNAVVIQWDSTAELSIDTLEGGMDFLGYRIYRARRTDLDTFNVDYNATLRQGPLAWKQIGQYGLTSPFVKSDVTIEEIGLPLDEFEIADIIKPGQRKFLVARYTSNSEPWGSYFRGLLDTRNGYQISLNPDQTLNVNSFDKYDSVRFTYFTTEFEDLPTVNRTSGGTADEWGLDSTQADLAKDSLIQLILAKKTGVEPFTFTDTVRIAQSDGSFSVTTLRRPFEEHSETRHSIIGNFIRTNSRSRTFYDFGDDDRNGTVLYDTDPERSEKLINNVNYYYAVRAYDEGDYVQGTRSKLTNRAIGLPNTVETMPLASRPGSSPSIEFRVDPADQARIGGIYNLRLLIQDQQRFNQLFAGRTLELEFFRNWFGADHDQQPTTDEIGMYMITMILRDSATQEDLASWTTALPPQLCASGSRLAGYFTENTVTWVDTAGIGIDSATGMVFDTVYNPVTGEIDRIDTTTFHLPDNTERVIRSGSYQTDATCFPNKYALGAVGLAFDYSFQQYGGVYRTVETGEIISGGDPNIYVGRARMDALTFNDSRPLNQPPPIFLEQVPNFRPFPGSEAFYPLSYNNGPGVYEITFEEGGRETITTSFRLSENVGDAPGKNPVMTFENVPYLNMKIRNVAEFDRQDVRPDGTIGSAKVSYPFDLAPEIQSIDTTAQLREFPNPELTPIGSYSVAAYGWRNSQNGDTRPGNVAFFAADSNSAYPLGQAKYYQSRNLSTTGTDTLDFCHVLSIGGAQFTIDFSRRGRRNNAFAAVPSTAAPATFPKTDFKAGDKIRVSTFGGALGYPFDNTKAYARVGQYDPAVAGAAYTDEQLEQIQVVPNPYYVTHEGIRSSFEGRLYFTRLPRKATISIYTTAGDLVVTYKHDETTSQDPSTFGTYVWDLLSKNGQRAVSQMLIAKIETPEGAQVMRKFSIVVGPARIVQE